jgi:phage terminase small subunit
MPVLTNPRYERFAQELAKGKTADEAYQLAGYKENRGNASTLKSNQIISDRVSEILGRAANRTELTVARVVENLERIAGKAEALGEASGLSVAKSAWVDAAKVHGLIVDKKEVGRPGDFSRMTEDEIDAFIASGQNLAGGSDSREASKGHEKGVRKPSGLH